MKIRLPAPGTAQRKVPVSCPVSATKPIDKLPTKGGWTRLPDPDDPTTWQDKNDLPLCIRARPHVGRTKHKWSDHEVRRVREIGERLGCWTCGSKDPGTPKGNFVCDHYPFYSDAEQAEEKAHSKKYHAQVLIPQCQDCSNSQGGAVMANRGSVHAKKIKLNAPGTMAKQLASCADAITRSADEITAKAILSHGHEVVLPPGTTLQVTPQNWGTPAGAEDIKQAIALLERAGIRPNEKGVISILVARPPLTVLPNEGDGRDLVQRHGMSIIDDPMICENSNVHEARPEEKDVGDERDTEVGMETPTQTQDAAHLPVSASVLPSSYTSSENESATKARQGNSSGERNRLGNGIGDTPLSTLEAARLPESINSVPSSYIGEHNSHVANGRPGEKELGDRGMLGRDGAGLPSQTLEAAHLPDSVNSVPGSLVVPSPDTGSGQLTTRPDSGPSIVTHAAYIERELQEVRSGLPALGCSNCAVSGECPEYQEGGGCFFEPLFKKLPVRDLDSQLAHIEHLLEWDKERTLRAMLAERLTAGGQIDPRVSSQLDSHIARLKDFAALTKRGGAPRAPMGSATLTARGPGLLAQIFGGALPAGSSQVSEIPLNEPVQPDGIMKMGEESAQQEEVTITVSAPEGE